MQPEREIEVERERHMHKLDEENLLYMGHGTYKGSTSMYSRNSDSMGKAHFR